MHPLFLPVFCVTGKHQTDRMACFGGLVSQGPPGFLTTSFFGFHGAEQRARTYQASTTPVHEVVLLIMTSCDPNSRRVIYPHLTKQWRGCPVVGDKEYGDFAANERVSRRSHNRIVAKRPLLHSMSLEFVHPITKKAMTFRSAMPNDMWDVASHILRSGTSAQRREFKNLQELRLMTPDEEAAAEARAVQNQRRATSADRAGRFRKGQGPGKNLGAQAAAAAVSSLGLKTKPP